MDEAGKADSAQAADAESGLASDDASFVSDGNPDMYASCTWTLGSGAPGGAAPTQNNSADLSGAAFGTVAFDASRQRRTVPVTVAASLPGLTLGPAYLTRLTPTDEAAFLTLSVTNAGASGVPCFVRVSTYQWLSATGQALNTGTDAYLDGSVGTVAGATDTDTCLAPGETGYLTEVEIPASGALYSAVTSIAIGLTSTGTATTPAAKLLPTRIDVGTCAANRALRVEGTVSGATVSVGNSGADLAPTVLFDSTGIIAGWTFFLQMQPSNVAPGAKAYFYDTGPEPAVSRAQVFLPFGPQDPTLMSLPNAMLREFQAMQGARSARAQRWQMAQRRALGVVAR
jgi:hypothetical protein